MADKKIQLHTKDGTDNLYPVTKAANVTGLATVATSGSYNDLSNRPSIPTIPTNYVKTDASSTITTTPTDGTSPLNIRNNGTYQYTKALSMLAPNMGANQRLIFEIGKASNTKNRAQFEYVHSSDGSNNNRFSLGMYGVDDVLVINGNGRVGIKNTSPTCELDVTGSTKVSKWHADSHYAYNLCRLFTTSTPNQMVIKTKIKYVSSKHMPVIRIYGYAYGLKSPIELKVGFYIYGGNLGWSGAVSMGAWRPEIYLFKYTEESVEYVALGLKGACYFPGFQVDAQVGASGAFNDNFQLDGWTTENKAVSDTNPGDIIPAVGTDNCIKVPYKSTLSTLSFSDGTTYDGTEAKTITYATVGAASSSHNHDTVYAKKSDFSAYDSVKAITAANITSWNGKGTYSKPSGGIPSTDVAFNYAGSSSKGGAASSVAQSLTFSNGGSGAASGTTYNGSTARTISYNSIGAAASSHTHAQTDITGLSTSLAAKLDKSEAEDTYATIDHNHSASDITSDTLAVARGGTGKTTGADAANYFLNSLSTGASTPKDADYFISQYANGGTTTTTYHRRPVSALWDLYKTKCITGVHANTAASSSVYTGKPIMFVPGNNMSVTVSNTTSYVRVLLDSYGSCLIEGTKIKMIDGSEKNIEDIEPGESIMSYDPNTRTNVEAVVVSNSCTGTADDYTNYYFDDGNFVTIYGKHCLYNADEGTARGVDFWEIGWTGMNDKNEEITFIGSEDISHAGRKKHYDIRSSNKLYYANGILTAQALTLDYSTLPDRDPELPQVFLDAIKADYDSSANITKHKMNKNYGKRLVPILREMKAQQKKMDDNKKRLADTDYIVSKFTEGLISASEWAKSKGERSNWRKLVNEAEDALVAVKTQFEALKEEYKPQSTKRERFNAAVARDNACLDALKEYYKEKNSK